MQSSRCRKYRISKSEVRVTVNSKSQRKSPSTLLPKNLTSLFAMKVKKYTQRKKEQTNRVDDKSSSTKTVIRLSDRQIRR
jgi:hypothetical protein